MKIAFRVDASIVIGIGHVMRCRTLALLLKEQGVEIHFIIRALPGNMGDILVSDGFRVSVLPAPDKNHTGGGYSEWLGVTQPKDALQTIEALKGERVDWLVVDSYGLDVEWEEQLRFHVQKLMVIDDLANRSHNCDVLIDQNYSLEGESRYAKLVPKTCNLLLGPKYALIRQEYIEQNKRNLIHDGLVRRVIIFFGGSDIQNITSMALNALTIPSLAHLEVDVVIGQNNPHCKSIERQIAARPKTNADHCRPHLADLMIKADLALGAGGTTTAERLCLGLPSIVIGIAKNQIPSCKALHVAGLINYLGYADEVKWPRIAKEITRMIASPGVLKKISSAGKKLVDGSGIQFIRQTFGNLQ